MEIEISDIVVSNNGRDADRPFHVTGIDEEYLLLADGKYRRVEKPKRKKKKHVRFEAKSSGRVCEKLRGGDKVTNSELRRSIAAHLADRSDQTVGGT
jgi:ribosomal protein L14E/L6E/L27E